MGVVKLPNAATNSMGQCLRFPYLLILQNLEALAGHALTKWELQLFHLEKRIVTFRVPLHYAPSAYAISKDEDIVLYGEYPHMRAVDFNTGEEVFAKDFDRSNGNLDIVFHANQYFIATVEENTRRYLDTDSYDTHVHIYNTKSRPWSLIAETLYEPGCRMNLGKLVSLLPLTRINRFSFGLTPHSLSLSLPLLKKRISMCFSTYGALSGRELPRKHISHCIASRSQDCLQG
jgi:hypothetical protein